MSVADYLRTLQEQFAAPFNPEYARDMSSDFTRAAAFALDLLQPDERSRLPDIAFGALSTWEGNAWAIPAPSDGVVICIDLLLPTSLRFVSRAIVQDMYRSGQPHAREPFANSSARVMWLTARWFTTRDLHYGRELTMLEESLPPLPEFFKTLYGGMVFMQLGFIVLHELYHVLRGHLKERHVASNERSPLTLDVFSTNFEKEFQADTGTTVAFARNPDLLRHGAVAQSEVFFLFLQLLDAYQKSPASTTHPPASARLQELRRIYDEIAGPIRGFGAGFRRAVDDAFTLVTDQMLTLPEAMWTQPQLYDEAVKRYVRLAVEGTIPANVTLTGEVTAETASAAAALANAWIGIENKVLVGTTQQTTGLMPDISTIAGIVGALAAVASLCAQLFQIRREAIAERRWNQEFLSDAISKELDRRGIRASQPEQVILMDGGLDNDGPWATVYLLDTVTSAGWSLEIVSFSGRFTIQIRRGLPVGSASGGPSESGRKGS